jgi:hypothetical protein
VDDKIREYLLEQVQVSNDNADSFIPHSVKKRDIVSGCYDVVSLISQKGRYEIAGFPIVVNNAY